MSVAVEFAPFVPPPAAAPLALVGSPGAGSVGRARRATLPDWPADTGFDAAPDTPPNTAPNTMPNTAPIAALADVRVLRAPGSASSTPPARLTRRGVVVVALGVFALCVALVWGAAASATGVGSGSAANGSAAGPTAVTVRVGDTLWSIAGRVAPDRDPRSEVALLQRVNHLSGAELAALVPGQRLRLR